MKKKKKSLRRSRKEIAKLRAAYKKGKLKFDTKKMAEGILEDLGFGIRK